MNNPASSSEIHPAPVATIVIPAHNEASVIARLLQSLPSQIGTGALQVIVACNACTDRTADIARKHGATVVEIPTASKTAALNAADEVALAFPRLYIDADIIVTSRTITDLVRTLSESDLLCAAPPGRMVVAGRNWIIRAYFAVWSRVMVARAGYVGSGVYAMSRKGRARFGKFPNVIADDLFVRNAYSRTERRVVATEPTIVEAPWTVSALLRRRIRVVRGNAQLFNHPEYGSLPGCLEPAASWWRVVLANPSLIPASIVYAGVNAIANFVAHRSRNSQGPIDWARDNTTRAVSQ
jgi:glycosyltransferase involved in cell wall biosynthesis